MRAARTGAAILLAPVLLFAAGVAQAQQWPQRAVRILVPFAAGGNTDTIARVTAERLSQVFSQQFVVENRIGAGGAIAAEAVARAAPDGHTLFVCPSSQMSVVPLMQKVSYDPRGDFAPISIIGSNPLILGVAASVPVKSFAELLAYIRSRPGKVPYASGGTGSLTHLVMVELTRRANLQMDHINYKGGAPAMVDLLGGQVPMYFGNLSDLLPHAKSEKLRLLANSGEKRSAKLPDVPTVAESGYPGFKVTTWNGLFAPARTPQPVIDRLAQEVAKLARDPAIISRLDQIGVDAIGSTHAEIVDALRADMRFYEELVRFAGIKID